MQAQEAGDGSRVGDAGELATPSAGEAHNAPAPAAPVQATGAGRLQLLCCQCPARKQQLMPGQSALPQNGSRHLSSWIFQTMLAYRS